ncbi:unnamed protein product [Psylliodes chrysocephalus]|uniref:Uncharacterized protein n=1 Tax=Psylliodes chrysocephalus TaxID=3402493 RepID=A0A9P0DG27_9CUCU|nr:unnamed protein product [Psylliodes chrysocephala]
MKCFISNITNSKEKVLLFNADTFQRCCLFIEIGKKNHFKYGDLILIPKLQKSAGYHLKCYRNLVAVKKSVVNEFNKSLQRVNTNNEKNSNAEPNISINSTDFVTDSASSSQILPLLLSNKDVDRRIGLLKRKATLSLLSSDVVLETVGNCNISRERAIIRDMLRAFSLLNLDKVPMWVGYNSSVIGDCSEEKNIDYMPPINSSPTFYNIVYETLAMSKEVADQCHQDQILVTYDLAIAKMAMQIQSVENRKFDGLFIKLGDFHMQLAFFKAVGALQMSHFDLFMSGRAFSEDSFISDLKVVFELPVPSHKPLILYPLLEEIIRKYKDFCSLILTGYHGKTGQFYLQYVKLCIDL